jgi:cobalt-zinc-cadmium efflux system protein
MAHEHVDSAAGRSGRRLALVLALTGGFAAIELVAGLLTGSLTLQADAAHMFTDTVGLALALGAIWLARRPASPRATYGYYRFEILAALVNALLLLGLAGYILLEAWGRFQAPPTVQGAPIVMVALAGLGVNGIGLLLLRGGATESLNVKGAFLELLSDALASVAALLAGVVIALTGWVYADPLFGALIGLFVIPRTLQLFRAALNVLLEKTPGHVDVHELERALCGVPGVQRVHDVHVWTITSGFDAMSGHVEVGADRATGPALAELRRVLRDRFGIEHATLQVEQVPGEGACADVPCAPRH